MLIFPTPSTRADSPFGFLTNALIAHYTFPGDARDRSQFSNDAVASSFTYVSDRFDHPGQAARFNGIADYMELPEAIGLVDVDQFTLSLWVEGQPYGTLFYHWVGQFSPGVPVIQPNLYLRIDNLQPHFLAFYLGQARASEPLPIHQWNHIALVFDGRIPSAAERIQYYVNGSPVSLRVAGGFPERFAIPHSHTRTLLGAQCDSFGQFLSAFLTGTLDDVRLHIEALSPDDVGTLYQIESRPPPQLRIRIGPTPELDLFVVPESRYQLQSSPDLRTWTDDGASFIAASSLVGQSIPLSDDPRFWRLIQMPRDFPHRRPQGLIDGDPASATWLEAVGPNDRGARHDQIVKHTGLTPLPLPSLHRQGPGGPAE